MTSEDDNKAAVRRFFEEGWNKGDPAELKAFLGDQFVSHNSLNFSVQSSDDYCRGVVAYRVAFPDLVTSVEDVIAEGDRVVVRGTDRGTHQGEFMGKAASGRFVTTTWIEIFRMESGKAVEGWVEADTKGLLDQLSP
ncbi:ester cyclase [Microlunatus panaciterrae]|uniref:Ester cyclase n=1 Tax=Microlunatus panaciterrae TaxID=400768 RepID=A0ABS2RMP3_9ACTN|nr:ester cyclase [Microlunatus panaciterrae]MBM7799988.1 putative ester cyclase [Microlunatus panaciterrae]